MSNGWIKIHRQIKQNWIWQDPIKLKWWLEILIDVNHSDCKVNIGMQIFDCKVGQSVKSLQNWATQFGTSKDKVRNFLRLLENDGMIVLENLTKTTRITVCNYDNYQTTLHDSQTQTKRKPNANSPKQEEEELKKDKNLILLLKLKVDEQVAKDFLTIRKIKRLPLTETALKKIVKEAENAKISVNDAIQYSVERGWATYKGDWAKKSEQTTPKSNLSMLIDVNQRVKDDLMNENF